MDAVAAQTGKRWVQAAWHRCTPTGLLVIPNGMKEPDAPARACTDQARRQISAALKAYHPKMVLITEFWSHHQSLLLDGHLLRPGKPKHTAALKAAYESLTAEIAATGAQTVFIDLSPPGESLGASIAAGRPAGTVTWAPGGEFVAGFNAMLHAVAAERPRSIGFISVDDLLCPGGQCTAVQNGKIIRTDGVHVTATESRQLVPALLQRAWAAASKH
jgi:hypothetical protein